MMKNTFITETDVKYITRDIYKTTLLLFILFSLFACFAFLIAWQTFVFIEGILLISFIYAVFSMKRRSSDCKLYFENDHLYITNRATGKTFEVYDIPASDFFITQTKKDKNADYCSMLIKNTIFSFGGIKNCTELKKYISENYR